MHVYFQSKSQVKKDAEGLSLITAVLSGLQKAQRLTVVLACFCCISDRLLLSYISHHLWSSSESRWFLRHPLSSRGCECGWKLELCCAWCTCSLMGRKTAHLMGERDEHHSWRKTEQKLWNFRRRNVFHLSGNQMSPVGWNMVSSKASHCAEHLQEDSPDHSASSTVLYCSS